MAGLKEQVALVDGMVKDLYLGQSQRSTLMNNGNAELDLLSFGRDV